MYRDACTAHSHFNACLVATRVLKPSEVEPKQKPPLGGFCFVRLLTSVFARSEVNTERRGNPDSSR